MPRMLENKRLITPRDLFQLSTGGDRVELWDGRLWQRDYPYEFLDTGQVLRGEILDAGDVVPGWRLEVQELFR